MRTETSRLKKWENPSSSEHFRFKSRKGKKIILHIPRIISLQNECLDINLNQDYFIPKYYSLVIEILGTDSLLTAFYPA
jgi:hypothetical protein